MPFDAGMFAATAFDIEKFAVGAKIEKKLFLSFMMLK